MWNSKFLNFSRWLGTYNRCANKNVDCIKLIKLLLLVSIKANLFALSTCRHIQSLPRTRIGKHCSKRFIYPQGRS